MVSVLIIPMLLIIPNEVKASDNNQINRTTQDNIIETIKPYVEVTKSGKIHFKNLPKGLYQDYNLSELQKHFDHLNELVESGTITINADLSIQDHSINLRAVYGKWTYHWWGYDRKFNNQQAHDYMVYLDTVSEGAGIITGAYEWLPPISGLSLATSAYLTLLSSRVAANNNGSGVYVSISYATVFNVEPL